MVHRLRALGTAILLAGPTALAFFSGGFFERPRLIAAMGAWALVALAALTTREPLPRSMPGRIALLALGLLTAWTAASYAWAPIGDRALGDTQRLILYTGTLVAAIALLRGTRLRRAVEPALAAGILVVIGYGLSERLLPTLAEFDRGVTASGRLEQPLTYWNGMGCLAAIGLVVCMRLAGDPERGRRLRAAAGAAAVPLVLGLFLSYSRGALFAAAVGSATLVLLAPSGRAQLQAVATTLLPGAVAAAVASQLPQVNSLSPGEAGEAAQGAAMLVVLGALAGLAAMASSRTAATAPGDGRLLPQVPRLRLAAGLAVLTIAGLATVAAVEGPQSRSAGQATSAARFASADSTRYAYWETAFEAFASNPIEGTGSGGFAVEWRARPDREEEASDAHSLYIETLSELGLVGALFLVLFVGGVAVAAVRLERRDPATAAGLVAGALTWAVHTGLDWQWELPAVTGVALILAGAIVAGSDDCDSADVRAP